MKRLLKWVARGLGALAALVVLALGVVYALSARIINRTYDVPAVAVAVPVGPAAAAEGKRLAAIRGCAGCHGSKLEGRVVVDEPLLATLASPNLSRLVPAYSDAELELLIRHGVRKNGRSVVGMPSSMFARLSDADLGAIIAYLRSVPPTDHELPTKRFGPLARLGLVLGKYHTEAAVIDQQAAHPAVAPATDRLAYGKYLALTSCTECHGPDLKGRPDGSRNLAVAAAYSDSAFRHFFRTGMALGNRRLALMSEMVEERFKHFTDAELSALHAYLTTLGGTEGRRARREPARARGPDVRGRFAAGALRQLRQAPAHALRAAVRAARRRRRVAARSPFSLSNLLHLVCESTPSNHGRQSRLGWGGG